MHDNPIVEQTAEISNRTTVAYLDQVADRTPVTDPLSGLKALGYGGNKGVLFSGAAPSEANAIKSLLLEGFAALPDCSYTDFGVSTIYHQSGYFLTTLVLAGP